MVNIDALRVALESFHGATPFDHCVIDNFFNEDTANQLADEFLNYDSEKWFHYKNPIEDKKALNDWNSFPPLTYRVFNYLNSSDFVELLSQGIGVQLFADPGLHGGGWHIHGTGGNLNPHLDYSIHPKLNIQRRLNIIIYLSKELVPEIHGGHLGLWAHDVENGKPGRLIKEVAPIFNRAILFDTTQNSWHGMSRSLSQPIGIYRKSFAAYYLCRPADDVDQRGRALFAARPEQEGDERIQEIIKRRSNVNDSKSVYVIPESLSGEE